MRAFDYFQFVFLVVFYVSFIGRTMQLMARGINPLVLGRGKSGFNAIVEKAFFAGLLLWTVEVISHALHLQFHLFPSIAYTPFWNLQYLKLLGCIVIFFGYIMFVWALVSFGHSWRIGIDKSHPGSLVTTGAFSVSRNPIFLFVDLYFLGMWLTYSNLFFLFSFVIAVAGIHYQILQEEAFLKKQYADGYPQYMRETRRYI
jgi:protein-S-isoprenylcysteine O-methyltransferase Ste14